MTEPNLGAPIAVFEGDALRFHWANEAWLAEWHRFAGLRPPAPGTPYAELATGRHIEEIARRAMRERRAITVTYETAYTIGLLTFIPLLDGRAVASHWEAAASETRSLPAVLRSMQDWRHRVSTAA